jgi:hypothetical protein
VNWSDIAGAVGKAAPILGTALGGPLGGVAGALIASALGTSNDADSVNTALAADPAALEKLKEAEMTNKMQMQQLVITAEANRLADVQNARARQTANPKDLTPTILAYTVVGAFVAMVAGMLSGWSHVDSALAGTLIGYLSAKAEQVIAYYFGSSKDSAGKTQMIADVGYAAASAPINIHSTQQAPTVGPSTLPEPSLFKGH